MRRSDALTKIQGHYNIQRHTAQELLEFMSTIMVPPPRQGALVGLDGFPLHCWDEATEVLPELPAGNCPVIMQLAEKVMKVHYDVFKKLAEND